ncbi:acetate--CoA ligase family protein [Streptomyces sp. NBC_00268]|uniref:acetate--CoA ligase family protein n=1 Tax=Streptomyces sp. NBC_00268 TaxID=2975695 RepID=UPI00224D516E|nr:acetate--CoA ligase family protein [Streptomyces sp. NBC_00268]MCX5191515.1 acetate--CoA ligase family protein [Streptomyces sp. NBC_00268]
MSFPQAFVDPSSIAVVGATEDRAKWGYWLATGALVGAGRRQVWLVNRRAAQVLGRPCRPTVGDLPETPDLVVLCVPSEHVLPVVRDALAKGCRAFLGITAGLGTDEDELAAMLNRAGARMIGPNSLGLFNAAANLRLAWGTFAPGSLAIVSQSGQLGSEIAALGARAGLGVSRFYSVGNQLDVGAADVLESLAADEHTTTVALYLESFADGARIVTALEALRRAGKHALVLTTGASEGSRRLARSHTGSMTSALDVVDAACRVAGALRVATPRELVDVARVLDATAPPGGRRVAIISDSGGQGGIAADLAASRGLRAPVFTDRLQTGLRALLPAAAAVSNPVDLAGAGEADLQVYAQVAELVAASGEVDAVVMSGYLGCYGEDSPSLESAEFTVIDRLGNLGHLGRTTDAPHVPLLVHSMSASSPAVARLREHRVPVFDTVDAALGALGRVTRLGRKPRPAPATERIAMAAPAPGYWAARTFLTALGIAMPEARRVTDAAGFAEACVSLRPPLVLKAGWIEHKSEHQAVRTGLGPDTAPAAFREMYERLGPGEYVVEEQDTRPGVVEMLIGARRNRDFGPTVAVGHGGVHAELWRDVSVELAPVDRQTAAGMLDRLRSRRLLDGWRGQPAVDVEALIDAIVAVSEAIAVTTGVADIEVNPIRVGPEGALAVDALVVSRSAPEVEPEIEPEVAPEVSGVNGHRETTEKQEKSREHVH